MDKKAMMEKLARDAYKRDSFNGTWLYAENGVIVSKGALGFRDAENTLPMREDTIFEMASVTKMFTAAAVMLLVREGKLCLDDEYTKFFPDYPYPGVTVRHLLTHTSGMTEEKETVDKWTRNHGGKRATILFACTNIADVLCVSSEQIVHFIHPEHSLFQAALAQRKCYQPWLVPSFQKHGKLQIDDFAEEVVIEMSNESLHWASLVGQAGCFHKDCPLWQMVKALPWDIAV